MLIHGKYVQIHCFDNDILQSFTRPFDGQTSGLALQSCSNDWKLACAFKFS